MLTFFCLAEEISAKQDVFDTCYLIGELAERQPQKSKGCYKMALKPLTWRPRIALSSHYQRIEVGVSMAFLAME